MEPDRRKGDAVLFQPRAHRLAFGIHFGRFDGDETAGEQRRVVVVDFGDPGAVGHIEIGARKIAHELRAVRDAEFFEFRGTLFADALKVGKLHTLVPCGCAAYEKRAPKRSFGLIPEKAYSSTRAARRSGSRRRSRGMPPAPFRRAPRHPTRRSLRRSTA